MGLISTSHLFNSTITTAVYPAPALIGNGGLTGQIPQAKIKISNCFWVYLVLLQQLHLVVMSNHLSLVRLLQMTYFQNHLTLAVSCFGMLIMPQIMWLMMKHI